MKSENKKSGCASAIGILIVFIALIVVCVMIANHNVNNSNTTALNTTIADTVENAETQETVEETTISELEINQLICDQNGLKIYFKGMEDGSFGNGKSLKLYFENSSEYNYKVAIADCNINDYTISPFLYTEVNSNKKANDEICIYQSILDDNGITQINKIEVSFSVLVDKNDDGFETFDTDLIALELS